MEAKGFEYRVVSATGFNVVSGGRDEALILAKAQGPLGARVERRKYTTVYGEWEEVKDGV